MKFKDATLAGTMLTNSTNFSTATFQPIILGDIIKGLGVADRVADSIMTTNLEWRMSFFGDAGVGVPLQTHFRFVLMWDLQPLVNVANLPLISEFFAVATGNPVTWQRNWHLRKRFRCIMDRTIQISNGGWQGSDKFARFMKFHKKIKKWIMYRDDGTGAVRPMNRILYYTVMNDTSGLAMTFTGIARMKYIDP